jgi:hypothetical protein
VVLQLYKHAVSVPAQQFVEHLLLISEQARLEDTLG